MNELAGYLDSLLDYEAGELDDDGVIEMFQKLINTGLVWQLQGCYGRTAMRLIAAGHCHHKENDE